MMDTLRRALLLPTAFLTLGVPSAHSICSIDLGGSTASPLAASSGTYTPPTSPNAQAVTITVTGTYTAILAGTCHVGIAFNRLALPASMARSGGGAALSYALQTAASGGSSLLYTGASNPALGSILVISFPAPFLGVARPFSRDFTVYALAQAGSPQQAGSYSDTALTLDVFGITDFNLITRINRLGFTMTGDVSKVCLFGGVATPTADIATIPISAGGVVVATPIPKSYANGACNAPSNLQLTSLSGAVKTAGTAGGLTNVINYAVSATFAGATATLNTATLPTATGAEQGGVVSTTGTTPNGTLSVTVTPQINTQPLLAGSYSDTLRITITPQ